MALNHIEQGFADLLESFGQEAGLPQRYFRAELRLNDVAAQKLRVHAALDKNAEFWAIAANALHLATLISLYRLFDTDSIGNVYEILNYGQEHPAIFLRTALARRRQQEKEDPSAHEATADDFIPLRKDLGRHRTLFDEKYRPIRGKILAHRVLSAAEQREIYASTSVVEVHEICSFFPALHSVLWQLYTNGLRPSLRPYVLSFEQIKAGETVNQGQHAVVRHTDRMLDSLIIDGK